MSLIQEALNRSNKAGAREQDKPVKRKIVQTGELISIIEKVLGHNVIDRDEAEKYTGHRTRVQKHDWPIANLQNHVDQGVWVNMVGHALEHMRKKVEHEQGNGDWLLMEYEIGIVTLADREHILCVTRWVDAKNAPDLSYSNGVPSSMSVAVSTSLPPEIIDVLKRAQSPANDPAMAGALSELAKAMRENQQFTQLLAAKLLEQPAAASVPASPDAPQAPAGGPISPESGAPPAADPEAGTTPTPVTGPEAGAQPHRRKIG